MGEDDSGDAFAESTPSKSDAILVVVEMSAPTVHGFVPRETGNMSSTFAKTFIKKDLPVLAEPYMVTRFGLHRRLTQTVHPSLPGSLVYHSRS